MASVALTALRILSYSSARNSDRNAHVAAAMETDNAFEHYTPPASPGARATTAGTSHCRCDFVPKIQPYVTGLLSRSDGSASAACIVNGSRGMSRGMRSPPPYVPGEPMQEGREGRKQWV